jgi:hypothetical protein
VGQVDVDGLSFRVDPKHDFVQDGNKYTATDATVSIGYVPAGTENFQSLIESRPTPSLGGEFVVDTSPGAANFEVNNGELWLVAVKDAPAVPIPIWKEDLAFLTVPIQDVLNSGFTFPTGNTVTGFEVAKVNFTLTSFGFHNPGGGDTSDAQVLMQGAASFENVPLLEKFDVKADVAGDDYVVADQHAITLTGLNVEATLGQTKIAGMDLAGKIHIGYHAPDQGDPHSTFTFGGTVLLSSQPDDLKEKALRDISAGLKLTVSDGQVTQLGFGIDLGFRLYSLQVSTVQDQPLAFDYSFDKQQFELSGGVQLKFSDNTITADFGNLNKPGLIIKDGLLQQFDASIKGTFHIAGATLSAAGPDGLELIYNRTKRQFEMGGGLILQIPTGNTTQTISASLLDPTGGPGLIVTPGFYDPISPITFPAELTQLDMQLSGGFDIYGLKLEILGAGVSYTRATKTLLIGGQFNADFGVFKTELDLGTGTNPGLSIINGKFNVDSVTFSLENAQLGPVTLNELLVHYQADGDSYDLGVSVSVSFAGFVGLAGEFDVVQGKLNTISIDATFTPGEFEIPATGLSITDIHLKLTNLDTPAQIVATGGLAVVWGEQVPMLGSDVYLFRAVGDVTASASELILDCQVQFGAYTTDQGNTWQGVLGQGDARLTLDWHDNFYAMHVKNNLLGIFEIEGDLVFAKGKDIALLGEATVTIPAEVPIIGGTKVAGMGFFFQHVFPHDNIPTSTTFAAWLGLDLIIWHVEVGFEIVIDGKGAKHFSLIGSSTIDGFHQDVLPPVDKTYTYTTDFTNTIPTKATSAVISVDWSQSAPGVDLESVNFRVTRTTKDGQSTTFTEDQFAANGIKIITDVGFSGPTRKSIQIVGSATNPYAPLDADYTLLVDIKAEGGNPFPNYPSVKAPDVLKVESTYQIPKPVFGPPTGQGGGIPVVVPLGPTGDFPMTLQGAMDGDLIPQASVSLYRVLASDPFRRGVLVDRLTPTQIDPKTHNGQNWQATFTVAIEGLYDTDYYFYAVVDDGFNVPVKSGNSATFRPVFAVEGRVANQNGDPEGGWAVFLDYNRDGKQDPNEPGTQTNAGGFYSFTFDKVPVNEKFNVVLKVPSAPGQPDHYVVDNNPVLTEFDGTHTVTVNFMPRERSAIKGTVFEDVLNNGVAADGKPVPGAAVYLDANGNGAPDPGEPRAVTDPNGDYSFGNLAPGTYTVAVDLSTLSRSTPVAAYDVPSGTVGHQADDYTYGMEFVVQEPVVLTSLGVFDSGQDGLRHTLTAVLYDAQTQAVLAQMVFTPGDPGTLVGGSRFKPLGAPITLLPGFHGIIAAYGFSKDDPADNAYYYPQFNPPWKFNDDVGALSPVSGRFALAPNAFPNIGDPRTTHPYAAGTFLYREPAWEQTKDTPATYTVTIDSSGFDLQEKKDFGALPPAFISGTITGYPLQNGQVQPNAVPQPGTTVQLLNAAFVLGVNAGGDAPAGRYLQDTYVIGGSDFTAPAAAIDTSHVFDPAPQAVYLKGRFGWNGSSATDFTYTIPGLKAGASYTVRLHFAEPKFVAPRQRLFGVVINGTTVLTDFDIFATAGAVNTAVTQEFNASANADGKIIIDFKVGSADLPMVNGIEILQPGSVLATTTTDVRGYYTFPVYAPGPYTVQEAPPAGWRQLAPFHSDLKLSGVSFPQTQPSTSVAVADYNGDGYADIAYQPTVQSDFSAPVLVAYNQKNGTFGNPIPYSYPVINGDNVVTGDFNGDHLPDLVVSQFGTMTLSVLLNTGSADLSKRFVYDPGFWQLPADLQGVDLVDFATGDMNKDGVDDLVLSYESKDSTGRVTGAGVAVLLGASQPAGRRVTIYPLPYQAGDFPVAGGVAVGDLNGDGNLDVFTSSGASVASYEDFNVAFGDGKGGLGSWQTHRWPDFGNGGDVVLGDVQGNGNLDAIAAGISSPNDPAGYFYQISSIASSGDGRFDPPKTLVDQTSYPTVPPLQRRILLKDVNGDLKPDLVLLLGSEGDFPGPDSVVVFLNTGVAPYFEYSQPLRFPIAGGGTTFAAGDLAIADLNNDGLNDIVVVNRIAGQGVVFLNQSPQNQPGFPITLHAGQVVNTADFLNVQLPSVGGVHGQVYEDANRNGGQDTGETGTPGSFVFVDLNRNGRYDAGEPSGVTRANGAYAISGLADGSYSVGIVPEDGWKTTSPAEFVDVLVSAQTPARADFGRVRRLLQPIADQTAKQFTAFTLQAFLTDWAAQSGRKWLFSLDASAPAGATIDPRTGLLTWTPSAPGTYPVTVRVSDPFEPMQNETVTFTVSVASVPATPLTPIGPPVTPPGESTVGVVDPATMTWYLKNTNQPGAPDVPPFRYGAPGWTPLTGDWDGNGTRTVGVFDPTTAAWYLRNENSPGAPDIAPFRYGMAGWIPVVGDWDGNGTMTIGVVDPATMTWYLKNTNGPGAPDYAPLRYGQPGDVPVVGDWDGDGTTTIGVWRPGTATWYLRNSNSPGAPDVSPFAYGQAGDVPVAGDWNADRVTTVGVFRPGSASWYLRNTNTPGAPDIGPFAYGGSNWLPVTGAYATASLLRAEGGAPTGAAPAAPLAQAALDGVVAAALARLQAAGVGGALLSRLAAAQFQVSDLPAGELGLALPSANRVQIDRGAAGEGWFVDPTPLQDEEYAPAPWGALAAPAGTPAGDHLDLLTAVLHELGHLASLPDVPAAAHPGDLMGDQLDAGSRLTAALDRAFAQSTL